VRDSPQSDESIIFEAEVAGTDEIRFWIMIWGSKAEVLGHDVLKEENREEVEGMLKGYQMELSMTKFPHISTPSLFDQFPNGHADQGLFFRNRRSSSMTAFVSTCLLGLSESAGWMMAIDRLFEA